MPEGSRLPMNGNDGREIAALIARLLAHYWTADDPEASRKAQILDWIEDLVEFGTDIVSVACGEWRRTQIKRPTPADIRRLAISEQADRRMGVPDRALPSGQAERIAAARIADLRMQTARYEDARLHRENWAHELGYYSFAQMMSIGLVNAVRNAPGATGKPLSAADHGVTAREYKPSAEEMSKGRRELGVPEKQFECVQLAQQAIGLHPVEAQGFPLFGDIFGPFR